MSCLDVHSNLWETSSVFDSDFSRVFGPINCQGTFCNCRGPKCLRRLTGLHRAAAPEDICPKKWGYLEDPMDYHGLSIHGIVMVPTDLHLREFRGFSTSVNILHMEHLGMIIFLITDAILGCSVCVKCFLHWPESLTRIGVVTQHLGIRSISFGLSPAETAGRMG